MKTKFLITVILILTPHFILVAQIKVNPSTKTDTRATNVNPDVLPVLQINVGDNTLKAGPGIQFTGKSPVYTIDTRDKITITAGEGIEISGDYPNFTVELKKHQVGEEYLGGIVFYVDESGWHGLVIKKDLLGPSTWSTFHWNEGNEVNYKDFHEIGHLADGIGCGYLNTLRMINEDPFNNILDPGEVRSIPEVLADDFSDWYLPSFEELRMIYHQKVLLKDILKLNSDNRYFWCSNEGGRIWKGHNDGPDGRDRADGGYFEGFSGKEVKLSGEHDAKDGNAVKDYINDKLGAQGGASWVTGAVCLDMFLGKKAFVAKTYPKSFVVIRRF